MLGTDKVDSDRSSNCQELDAGGRRVNARIGATSDHSSSPRAAELQRGAALIATGVLFIGTWVYFLATTSSDGVVALAFLLLLVGLPCLMYGLLAVTPPDRRPGPFRVPDPTDVVSDEFWTTTVVFKMKQEVMFPGVCAGCMSGDTSAGIIMDWGRRRLQVEEGTGSKVGRVIGQGALGGIVGGIVGSAVGAAVGKSDRYVLAKLTATLPLCPACREKLTSGDVDALSDMAVGASGPSRPVVTALVSRMTDDEQVALKFANAGYARRFCESNPRTVQPAAPDRYFT